MSVDTLEIGTILSQIFVLFLLAGIGFLSGRTGYLPASAGAVLSKIVIRISMPALILSKMLTADLGADGFADGFVLTAVAVVCLLLTLLLSRGVCAVIGKFTAFPEASRNVYALQSMFGNVSFFAFPLFLALFGDIGVIYALFFNMGNDLLLWSVGIYLAGRHRGGGFKSGLRHLLNANTIAFLLGLILLLLGAGQRAAEAPAAIAQSYHVLSAMLSMVGSTTSPLSMIFIGFILADTKAVKLRELRQHLPALALSFQKLLLVPFAAGVLLYILRSFGLVSDVVLLVAVLQLAMPVGTITASLAAEYGSDYKMATYHVFVTTLLSAATLPLTALLLKLVLA